MSQVLIRATDALTQKEAKETERAQAEAEANAREVRLKVQEHQRRFTCHIDGCTHTSAGPALKSYGGHWVWDWHQPTELTLCERCFSWTCSAHCFSAICQRCMSRMS